jgi:hypothetical protein
MSLMIVLITVVVVFHRDVSVTPDFWILIALVVAVTDLTSAVESLKKAGEQ